jgi:hypothetical protein
VGSWIDEIGGGAAKAENATLRAALPSGVTEGNLAALEEDDPSSPADVPPPRPGTGVPFAPSTPPQPMSPSAAASSARALPPQPPSSSSLADRGKPGPSTKVGVLVALVVVMAAGAAAWFTHLIPHGP